MKQTTVVHWKHSDYDVDIRRPAKWGNPFKIGVDGTRAEVIKKFEDWIREQPHLLADIEELRGKRLGCWCAPKPCHGDVLVKILTEREYTQFMEF